MSDEVRVGECRPFLVASKEIDDGTIWLQCECDANWDGFDLGDQPTVEAVNDAKANHLEGVDPLSG